MKKRKFIGIILSVIIILSLGGNVFADDRSAVIEEETPSVWAISVKPYEYETNGEVFTITLNENPTAGYKWVFTSLYDDESDPVIEASGDEYTAPDSELLGAGGKHSFSFKALNDGKCFLVFDYKRSWEEDSESTFQFSVKVEDGKVYVEPYSHTEVVDSHNGTPTLPKGTVVEDDPLPVYDPAKVDVDKISESIIGEERPKITIGEDVEAVEGSADTETATVKAGFFRIIINFFINLFNSIFGN